MTRANPNGANGNLSDPREQKCWDFYVKTIQENRANAYQSAIDAGYEESTAKTITTREWFKERLKNLKRKEMLSKAERNLDKMLDENYRNDEGKIQPEVAKIVIDVSKTIVKTLGKDDGYSEKIETDLTSKGEKIVFLPSELLDKHNLNETTQSTITDSEGQPQI